MIPGIGGVIKPPGSVPSPTPGAPPAPPSVNPTSLDIVADPADPGPAQSTTLTITASGTHGVDKYGVKDVKVALQIAESPGPDAKVDPAQVSTDASGTATAKFTTAKLKGRNTVIATAGTLTNKFNIDTLLGSSGSIIRGRHSGNLDPVALPGPRFNPALIFAGAGLILLVSFVIPYRRRIAGFPAAYVAVRRRRKAQKRPPVAEGTPESEGWGPSSRRKSRARPSTGGPGA